MIGSTTQSGPESTAELVATAPTLTVMAHPDPARVGERALLRGSVQVGRATHEFRKPSALAGEPLGDPFLSRKPVVVTSLADGSVELDQAGSPTTITVDLAPVSRMRIDSARLDAGVVVCLGRRVTLFLHRARVNPPVSETDAGMIGVSDALSQLREEVRRVAKTRVPVLILGESGVGKELVARAIHGASERAERPFEAVNMAAIPAGVAASELFGHERGAFTGADRAHAGCFVRADGGSLFLDELGDTPLEVQPLLLRALQSGEIQPLGAQRPRRVDVRLLAATDVALDAAVEDGAFRSSLLHRLAGYKLRIAPLRERRDDLGPLLHHFVRRELAELGCEQRLDEVNWKRPWLSAVAVAVLACHGWPGNVRELRNVARQLVILHHDAPYVSERHAHELLGSTAAGGRRPSGVPAPDESPPTEAVASPAAEAKGAYRDPGDVTEDELLSALRLHAFSLEPTAKALGISRTSLYALVERSPRVRKASELTRGDIDQALEEHDGRLVAAAAALGVSAHALKLRLKALEG